MLEVRGLSYRYESMQLTFDLEVEQGECVAVIGPSGAGKSTLLSLLGGFIEPRHGSIKIAGKEMIGLPPSRRPVTTVFQEHNLFPHLDMEKNVALGIHPGLRLNEADRLRVHTALEQVGLGGLSHRKPGELSGGQRQRVALARAIVRDRPLLLLDEPFAGLGPALRTKMLELLDDLRVQSNLTMVLVSHHPEDARRVAERTAFMHDGEIKYIDQTDSVLTATRPKALRDYLGTIIKGYL